MSLKIRFKNKIINTKLKIISKIKEYFLFRNSIDRLSNFAIKFYVCSIGIDDIYYGNKHPKRFKICILNCLLVWLSCLSTLTLLLSDQLFSPINIPLFSGQLKIILMLLISTAFMTGSFKTDFLIGEINYNLSPLKVIYYLKFDLKNKHNLNDKNYKKLTIWFRIVQIVLIDCGIITLLFVVILIEIKITILFNGTIGQWIIWTYQCIHVPAVIFLITSMPIVCLAFLLFIYYKMIFDQINDEINSIYNEKSLFFKTKFKTLDMRIERQLMNIVERHNLAAIEIHKINLIVRRSTACLFINFSFIKITILYLIINVNKFFLKFILIQTFIVIVTFMFGVTYLLTQQIKSAHQPLNTVHSIVCKYKMNLRVKLKVS